MPASLAQPAATVNLVSPKRRRLMLVLGLAAVLPLLAVDPAVVALLLDADLLALVGVVGLALLRGDAGLLRHRVAVSLPALWIDVGLRLSRERPRTLVA
jgi:hypothetical protein